jgi:pyruvate carboxylase
VLLAFVQPDSGRLEAYRPPGGPGIRLDSAVTAGNVISRYYDSLLSKVIASAPTFDKAVQRMARALQEFQVGPAETTCCCLWLLVYCCNDVWTNAVMLSAVSGPLCTRQRQLCAF